MLTPSLKKNIKNVLAIPSRVKTSLHQKFPHTFGHEIKDTVVQVYRWDSEIETVVSFNHFIEFFSQKPVIDILLHLEAWNCLGKSLGQKIIRIEKKGVWQTELSKVFPNLDKFGLFSVRMSLAPKFEEQLNYLGALSPQFMTMYVPKGTANAPQMIHSHKIKQGFLWPRRTLVRKSTHRELIGNSESVTLLVPNSGSREVDFQLEVVDAFTEKSLHRRHVVIPGYGVEWIDLPLEQFQTQAIRFNYGYDLPVDHKKPIVFRTFKSGTWSCNHT